MALLSPVAARIRCKTARPMSFKLNKNLCVRPKLWRLRFATAAAAALLATFAGNACAQLMSVPGAFSVSTSGAANYSIPIVVPPGTAGMAPSLSLDLSSQGGNGIVGMGWSLSGLAAIGRCPQTKAQDGVSGTVSYTASDRFCLSGQRLFAISGNYGGEGTEYRTEIESFSRVISHGSAGNGPAWFEVHTKSGQTIQFGNTADSRILAQCTSTARSWAVNKVSDTKGNYYTITYQNDSASCGGNGQAYPIEIDYTGNAAAGVSPYNKVVFAYTSRPDIAPVYQAGSLIRTTVLLTDVKTYAGASLVADYKLAYQQGNATGRSRLTSVTLCAGDGSCLPATALTWQEGGTGVAAPITVSSYNGFDSMGAGVGPGLIALDLNSDGKTDFVQQWNNGGCLSLITYISNGDGTFNGRNFQPSPCQPFNSMYIPFSGPGLGPGLIALDLNGDGKTDLVQQLNNNKTVSLITYISNGDGTFTVGRFDCPECGFDSIGSGLGPGLLPLDLNGDGRTDLIQQWNNGGCLYFITWLNNGNGTFNTNVFYPGWCDGFDSMGAGKGPGLMPMDLNGDGKIDLVQQWNNNGHVTLIHFFSNGDGTFTPASFDCPHCGFDSVAAGKGPGLIPLDLNGDGNIDLVQQWNNGGCLYFVTYINQGNGTFNVNTINPATCNGFDSTGASQGPGLLPLDLNGDGKTDLVQQWNNNGTLWLVVYYSKGDGTFTASSFSSGTSFYSIAGSCIRFAPGAGGVGSSCTSVAPVDLNGDGKSDLVGQSNNGGILYFISLLANAPFPDLLTNITTGLGATTAITYLPLTNGTNIYIPDTGFNYPVINLSAPLYVAARVDTSNGIGRTYSTIYGYYGAKSDLSGRGFLGFRQMNTVDLQTNVVTGTGFNQNFPFIGTVAWEWKGTASQAFNSSSNTYQFFNASGASSVSSPSIASAPYRVSLTQSTTASNDLDGTALPTITTTYQYDVFNNPTQVVVSTPDGFSKTTTNTYINDTANWFLGRLTQSQVASTAPSN
jgi:Salmonella virulence plasmid 65kDa B protein/Insecticide toxin TcdB middle/N-terminal region/FG-GAP-like repeat